MTFLKRKAEPVGISVYYAKRRTWKIIWSFIRTVFILGFQLCNTFSAYKHAQPFVYGAGGSV